MLAINFVPEFEQVPLIHSGRSFSFDEEAEISSGGSSRNPPEDGNIKSEEKETKTQKTSGLESILELDIIEKLKHAGKLEKEIVSNGALYNSFSRPQYPISQYYFKGLPIEHQHISIARTTNQAYKIYARSPPSRRGDFTNGFSPYKPITLSYSSYFPNIFSSYRIATTFSSGYIPRTFLQYKITLSNSAIYSAHSSPAYRPNAEIPELQDKKKNGYQSSADNPLSINHPYTSKNFKLGFHYSHNSDIPAIKEEDIPTIFRQSFLDIPESIKMNYVGSQIVVAQKNQGFEISNDLTQILREHIAIDVLPENSPAQDNSQIPVFDNDILESVLRHYDPKRTFPEENGLPRIYLQITKLGETEKQTYTNTTQKTNFVAETLDSIKFSLPEYVLPEFESAPVGVYLPLIISESIDSRAIPSPREHASVQTNPDSNYYKAVTSKEEAEIDSKKDISNLIKDIEHIDDLIVENGSVIVNETLSKKKLKEYSQILSVRPINDNNEVLEEETFNGLSRIAIAYRLLEDEGYKPIIRLNSYVNWDTGERIVDYILEIEGIDNKTQGITYREANMEPSATRYCNPMHEKIVEESNIKIIISDSRKGHRIRVQGYQDPEKSFYDSTNRKKEEHEAVVKDDEWAITRDYAGFDLSRVVQEKLSSNNAYSKLKGSAKKIMTNPQYIVAVDGKVFFENFQDIILSGGEKIQIGFRGDYKNI